MKRSPLRAFGIACFLIGLLIIILQKVNLPITVSVGAIDEVQYKMEIDQLEQQLNEANEQLLVLEQNVQQYQLTKEVLPKDKDSEAILETKKTETDHESINEVVTGTLYIYSGLTPAEVAQKLKDLKIINNSIEMELFLAQPEYATTIQKGQFHLNSTMSIEEIANIITGKPANE